MLKKSFQILILLILFRKDISTCWSVNRDIRVVKTKEPLSVNSRFDAYYSVPDTFMNGILKLEKV